MLVIILNVKIRHICKITRMVLFLQMMPPSGQLQLIFNEGKASSHTVSLKKFIQFCLQHVTPPGKTSGSTSESEG